MGERKGEEFRLKAKKGKRPILKKKEGRKRVDGVRDARGMRKDTPFPLRGRKRGGHKIRSRAQQKLVKKATLMGKRGK